MVMKEMKINKKLFNKLLNKKANELKINVRDLKGNLCRELKVSKQTMHLWCSGKMKPAIERLLFFQEYFKLKDIKDLLLK